MKIINIKKNVLAANDILAEKLRREFKKKNIFTINIIGSPGCGKTTLLEKTIAHFAGKINIFTLVGDVQTEADADRLKNVGGRAKQIITGGACHLDARMIEREIELLDLDEIEFLVIENVGNLVCPSSYDLGEDEKVVIVSVPEGDEKPLKYPSIFHRSSLFIVTKTDLLGTSDFSIDKVIENAKSINPALTTMKVSAKTDEGMSEWFNWIQAGLDKKRKPINLKIDMPEEKRHRFTVTGTIQGVGFRPFIYRLALSCNLTGFALNSTEGVIIEIQGDAASIDDFASRIISDRPPLAEITGMEKEEIPLKDEKDFRILSSESTGKSGVIIIPQDISTCDKCFEEITDQDNRRYAYPFTNCTDCGPRYTIISSLPYDRSATTMAKFTMCADCMEEYRDPLNRRFHAEPNACPVCGPQLNLLRWSATESKFITIEPARNPLEETIAMLEDGEVAAIKGLGGFHLACDADNEQAVKKLRAGKNRIRRPLAVMSRDIESIREFCGPDENDIRMMTNPRRPIVLVRKDEKRPLAPNVAPCNDYYGVMLPYTPLHYLLLRSNFRALVMTSANNSGEPIIKENLTAFELLKEAADCILIHDRDILIRCDDSIARWDGEQASFIRLSRGWAPLPLKINSTEPDRIACGAELKNTFTVVKKDHAFVSGHIGNLENYKTYEAYRENIDHLIRALDIKPETILHDLHPDYLSSIYAAESEILEKIPVQHHHSHILSCMAEHGLDEPVIGIVLDGTGYGDDDTIWGGEILLAERTGYERLYHFTPVALAGGDASAKEPWRMMISYLHASYNIETKTILAEIEKHWEEGYAYKQDRAELIIQSIEKKINAPLTSACGRLFAAVSALLGIRQISSFDGEAEINLEWFANKSDTDELYNVQFDPVIQQLPTMDIFRHVVEDFLKKTDKGVIARKFHNTLVDILCKAAYSCHEKQDISKVVLTGGVFQNMLILNGLRKELRKKGLTPISHGQIPSNDAGISVGQAYFIKKR